VPVLVEMTSVVLPAAALRRPGVDEAIGSATAVARAEDGELVAAGFGSFDAIRQVVSALGRRGLQVSRGQEPGEVAVVDQREGPLSWWPWLELAVVDAPDGSRVLAARRSGSADRRLATPPGWRPVGSASERHGVVALEAVDRPLRHVRREADADLYLDRWTGEEIRLERASPRQVLAVEGPAGSRAQVTVEVASRWPEIELGLMFRESLGPDEGMLFRFGGSRRHGFWMKNTLVPLDVLFIGEAGRVVNVAERTRPLRVRQHRSAGPVREVLELPGGWCAAHGVGPGARVRPAEPLPVV
jgi:uncharacterized membrane protein (UPF0127 family)